jgi:hypothetical protein
VEILGPHGKIVPGDAVVNLILHLTPETEIRLQEIVSLTGRKPEELALEALQDKLSGEPGTPAALPIGEWLQEFDAWVRGHESRNPHMDDSRDSIYPDRW